jgi:hypothetical protein
MEPQEGEPIPGYQRDKPLDLLTHDELVAKSYGPYGRPYMQELERRAMKNTPAPFLMERSPRRPMNRDGADTPFSEAHPSKEDIAAKYTPPPDPLERIANALERIVDKIDGWSYIGDQN